MAKVRHSKSTIIWTWVIASLITLGMGLPIFFTSDNYNLVALANATFIPGALLLGLAGLIFIGRTGTFDILAYSFVAMGQRFRPRELRKYKDAADYKEQVVEKRSKRGGYILPFLILGTVLLVVALIATIIFNRSVGA